MNPPVEQIGRLNIWETRNKSMNDFRGVSNLKTNFALLLLFLIMNLTACMGPDRPGGGLGPALKWTELPGWRSDNHSEAWQALMKNCQAMASKSEWKNICKRASLLSTPSDQHAREFFEKHFSVKQVIPSADDKPEGLITGYYEPILNGSLKKTKRFQYPVYKRPDDLLIVELGGLYPELKGKRVRARIDSRNRVVPYFDRAAIDGRRQPLKGKEIAWVDDIIALFFTHIQGSARIRLTDGSLLSIGYHDQNGHPYYAIGRQLIEKGIIAVEDMSMQAIRQWLLDNPNAVNDLLNSNSSYIFFIARENKNEDGPLGSLGVALTAQRSIAVDRRSIPLGSPVWLSTQLPNLPKTRDNTLKDNSFAQLVFAQDTGGAIKGNARADLFWGSGEEAEYYAGKMRQSGLLYLLIPK